MQYSKETDHWSVDFETDWESIGFGIRVKWHKEYYMLNINIGFIVFMLLYFTKTHIDVPDDVLEDC